MRRRCTSRFLLRGRSRPPSSEARPRPLGFTLLEVMVAIAILGLSLTVILSAQTGLYSSAGYAQKTSVAVGLARCKMTELEERLLKLGYPLVEEIDEGPCCGDDTRQDMRCKWRVERVELPTPIAPSGMGDGGLGLASAMGSAAGMPGASPTSMMGGGPMGPLGVLMAAGSNPASLGSSGDGGISALGGAMSGSTMGGTAAVAPLVMGIVYPTLKPMLEASIRKLTVTITWKEGLRTRDFDIVQYVTNPVKGGLLPGDVLNQMPGGLQGAPPGGSGMIPSKP